MMKRLSQAPQNLNKIYFENLTENILNDFELRFLKDFKPDRAPPEPKEKIHAGKEPAHV
jgi:hypothetical protein